MKTLFFLLLATPLFISCNNDNSDTLNSVNINFKFSQNWDGVQVTNADFNNTIYVNEMGRELNISRMRYLLSRFTLTNQNGDVFSTNQFNLVDMANNATLTFNSDLIVPEGTYTLSFIYGFNQEDNIDGAYPILNSASWNWPESLGGGYHFMQYEGSYDVNTEPKPYNLHNGTARVSEGVFEQNFVTITLTNPLVITTGNEIEIKMDIAEWFKNPDLWDLDLYNVTLMPNYAAQKLMQRNTSGVFSATIN
ncbi:MAG: hypothetical protein AUK33_05680 [Flavobacteriaceae bacterium CG2_30_34_30]|nr:hypothetical protein [Flavobacteriia bacterium]OIP50990.1 MAG: hypothetical protein AUK33_05680 [Flavobacteriaceae bacterium CG2_30_34_30]PIQ18724.1 MAG: hypothetical protein COW66_05185 [Flavobacteriaceae bacterium CG18_big_fil_WC_8_21_14_2_50_34_36]PIV48725.1 MAG: hypothetical protein COS19_12015 [Flavobacteriaceae bacterium CG02_land_8_20_14_3_00_34_13]PIZ07682.1 MAG: hypothetical protein COY56_07680 [Flavobacteriaceae bacterium CG_4_10_14_0_8_um_filter_34_31]PJC07064.1 MAG: hypothetical